jgi:hypothetical protein
VRWAEVHAKDVSSFSRLGTAEEFRRPAMGELFRRGAYSATTVCTVMDGAEWLQKLLVAAAFEWHYYGVQTWRESFGSTQVRDSELAEAWKGEP